MAWLAERLIRPGRFWQYDGMRDQALDDGVVRLREWADDDAAWYAGSVRDPLIQRFTTESPALDAEQVLAAIGKLRVSDTDVGFVVCDAVIGARLGNIALGHDGHSGEISYWVAAEGRGRGVATRALALFSTWSFHSIGLQELWLLVHQDNIASQRVALHAGYRRDPGRDKFQHVKGATWPMLGFALSRPGRASGRAAAGDAEGRGCVEVA
jgi:RimJ/RimL family protein N-acetyltransferase